MGVKGRRWIKTRAREAYWVEKNKIKAQLQAEKEAHDRNPFFYIKSKFLKMLERVDPLKAIAIIGATIAVHEFIMTLDEVIEVIGKRRTEILDRINRFGLYNLWQKWVGGEEETPNVLKDNEFTGELLTWLISFAIAYFAVEHGAEVLGVAKAFLGSAGTLA